MLRPRLAAAIVRAPLFAITLTISSCGGVHTTTPALAPSDASGGHAPRDFDASHACSAWRRAVGPSGGAALVHDSFPELDPAKSCFVPVRYGSSGPHADAIPSGCGYPDGAASKIEIDRRADRYERIARGVTSGAASEPLPLDLACSLPDDVRIAAARANARTLRALSRDLPDKPAFAYAAVAAFGYGNPAQNRSPLVAWRPGDACLALDDRDMRVLSVNVVRAARAAEARLAGVAPIVTVSGGAVHSDLVEAFMLDYLLVCRFGVAADSILLDPCADHTHTNVRNTGALVRGLGGRTAYVVTDDGMQADYLEEWTSFDMISGSIDQRSLRDFGYLVGSFRRASEGMRAGFWYTPYRFWAEPRRGLGSFTCVP